MTSDHYDQLVADIGREFPGFRLVRKHESLFQHIIHYALVMFTLGRMRRYLHEYQTTIGWTVYVTRDFDEDDVRERYITLRHELVHLRQFRRYTRLGMGLLYLLVPLPLGLAYFRARFEQEAYTETIRVAASVYGLEHVREPEYREDIVSQFVGPEYGWMWPFRKRVEAWYDSVVATVAAELLAGELAGEPGEPAEPDQAAGPDGEPEVSA